MKKWAKSLTAAVLLVCLVVAEAAPATVYAQEEEEEDTGEEAAAEAVEAEPEEEPEEEADAMGTPAFLAAATADDTEDDGDTEDTIAEAALKSVSVSDGSIKVTWKAVDGAASYTVYRKASGGSWKKLKDTTSTSYTDKGKDKSLSYNTLYYYSVQAHSGTADSTYGTNTISAAYYKAPSSVSLATTTNGIKISWKKVSGASGYGIYRMASNEKSYTLVKTVSSGTLSYKDKDSALKSGTKYYYRVRAYKGDASAAKANPGNGQYWGLAATGTKCYYLKAPTLKSASVLADGTKVSWKKVTGAAGYAVYRKKGSSGSWKRIATTTKTSYTDTASLKSGKTYYYTVRAYRGKEKTALNNTYDPTYWSYRDGTGVKSVYLKKVSVTGATKKSSGVKVTWDSVSGADGYGLFRKKGSSGSWKLVSTTKNTSYTDKSSLTKNKTYYYTVRAYKGSKSKAKADVTSAAYWGLYDDSGFAFSTATTGAAMDAKAQQYSSNTNYLILVDCTKNRLAIYTGKKGSWSRKYYWKCSTGKASTPTKKGQYTVSDKGKSFGTSTYTCWWWTRWSGNYLMHSVLYYPGSMTRIKYGKLGANLSHGCVRLDINNAKWIYDHIPRGTKVVTY